MKTPELIAAMAKLGFEPQFWSPQDYAAFLADDMRRWPPLVKTAGIKPDEDAARSSVSRRPGTT